MLPLRNDSKKLTEMGMWVIRSIFILATALFLCIALALISEKRYYNATGWIILSTLTAIALALLFIKPKAIHTADVCQHSRPIVSLNTGDDLVLLYSSKDIIRITQIQEALMIRGIDCIVLDQNGSVMMSFIPEIDMKLMVQRSDFEWSIKILNDLLASEK